MVAAIMLEILARSIFLVVGIGDLYVFLVYMTKKRFYSSNEFDSFPYGILSVRRNPIYYWGIKLIFTMGGLFMIWLAFCDIGHLF